MAGNIIPIADFDPAYRLKILESLIGPMNSMMFQVFKPERFTEMSGKVPYRAQKYTLGNANNKTKVAFDAEPLASRGSLSSVEIQYDGIYKREAFLTKANAVAMNTILEAQDIVEYLVKDCMIDIATDIDVDYKPLLTTAGSVNNSVAATDVWSDESAARPMTDFEAACDAVGNPDLCWLGLDRARELAKLPAFKTTTQNFDGVNSSISFASLAQKLKEHFGFQQVIIDNSWYNTANEQQTISKSRIFDGVVFVGHAEHFVAVENPELREVHLEYNPRRGRYEGMAAIAVEMERADKDAGCIITGT